MAPQELAINKRLRELLLSIGDSVAARQDSLMTMEVGMKWE